jgi:putative tryptophan/tyrosine transport system substrate-binding protein
MRRREFIRLLGGAALTWPRAEAWPQDVGRNYRLGVLVQAPRIAAHWTAFFDELRKYGFDEGRNVSVADGFDTPLDRAEIVAKTIVNERPDVIMTAGVFTRVIQRETQTIPILTVSDDLLAEHAVASLAHPGANITGISILATELDGKRQEILLDAFPLARRIAILADSGVTKPPQLERLTDEAKTRGVSVSAHLVASAEEIMPAVDAALATGAQALNVLASSLLNRNRAKIIAHAAAIRLAAIYQWPEMAEEGGLIAYGPRFVALYRQHALQAVKVLKGTKPADIPVEQPTTFELVINLKTAKTIGLTIPPSLLVRATEVIE